MEDRKNILILFFIVFLTICCNDTQSLQNEDLLLVDYQYYTL